MAPAPGILRAVAASSFALLLLFEGRAGAQPTDPEQIAVAQALVDEGRKLIAAGKIAEACPKFEEAVRVARAQGIAALAQLAECYEKAGRLAGAWGTWIQVESAASRAGQAERAQYARERVTALLPRLPRLAIVAPLPLREMGVDITRDGKPLPPEQWGLPVPVDPGRHTVRVTAPKRTAWEAEIDVRTGEVQLLAPARLEDATPAPAPSPAAPSAHDGGRPPIPPGPPGSDAGKVQRRIGIALGGAGILALEVGGGFLVANVSKAAAYDTVCSPSCKPTDPGSGLRGDAIQARNAAIVSGALGAAALATGIAVYLTAPLAQPSGARAARYGVAVNVGPGGAALSGRW